MAEVRTDTPAQARRREASENARAIVAFAGGTISSEMEELEERVITGELTSEQAIAEYLRPYRCRSIPT
ncbi:MAG: antitoxin VbhA family protein [Acidimicrobiales bacterium]